MRVSQKTGIIVVTGKIIKTDYKVDKDGYMRGIYYLRTKGVDWIDPTGQKGAENVNWTISAWDFAAGPADPKDPYVFEYIAIEAIPKNKGPDIWRSKTNRPREAIKLHALFTQPVDQKRLMNTIKYHRRGTIYSPWWRPDIFRDDDPDITGEYDDSGYDYGLGFQDDMRGDMEFFYEDERWSRDPQK